MNIFFFSFVAFIFLLAATLYVIGRNVRDIKREVKINASPEQLWELLTDFNRWNEWNSTIKESSGHSSEGSVLNITINGNGQRDSNYHPIVIESKKPEIFRWRANMISDFVFRNDRVFEIQVIDGVTHFTHKEEFSGLMVPIMWKVLQSFVGPHLDQINHDLIVKLSGN